MPLIVLLLATSLALAVKGSIRAHYMREYSKFGSRVGWVVGLSVVGVALIVNEIGGK